MNRVRNVQTSSPKFFRCSRNARNAVLLCNILPHFHAHAVHAEVIGRRIRHVSAVFAHQDNFQAVKGVFEAWVLFRMRTWSSRCTLLPVVCREQIGAMRRLPCER